MMIRADLGTCGAIVVVCAHHLGREFVVANADVLIPSWFLDLDFVHAVEKDGQVKAVKDIQDCLAKALRGFYSLHPDLRQAIEWQVSNNLATDEPMTRLQTVAMMPTEDIDEEDVDEEVTLDLTPFKSHENLEILIRAALSSFIGVPADTLGLETQRGTPGKSAKSTAKSVLTDLNMKDLTYHQREGETWQKALTVKRCRDLWAIAKEAPAPKAPSGQFGLFFGDTIYALGKGDDWPVLKTVMRSWAGCAKEHEWFL